MKNVYLCKVTYRYEGQWQTTVVRVFTEEKYAIDYCEMRNAEKYEDHSRYYYDEETLCDNYLLGQPYKETTLYKGK